MKLRSENTAFLTNHTLNLKGRLLDLSLPKIMGILNVTPDSFYDGNFYRDEVSILRRTTQMLEEGAAMIDLGGCSTRPGATDISTSEEMGRVIPALKAIKREYAQAIISIDTFRSEVAEAAVNEGADLVNDISGGSLDGNMLTTVANLGIPFIAMHMRGTPQTMSGLTNYEKVCVEVVAELQEKVSRMNALGISDIIVDPGFGFSKTLDQNFELLANLEAFKILGKPLLVGISRKSMIWKTLKTTPDQALAGTVSLNTIALMKGASILRVHDVKEGVHAIELINQLYKSNSDSFK